MDDNDALQQRMNVLTVQRISLENKVAVLEVENRGLVEQLAKARANEAVLAARCRRMECQIDTLRQELIDERVQVAELTEEIEGADDLGESTLSTPRSLPILDSMREGSNG